MRHKINFLGLFLIVMCCTTQGYSQQAFTELTEFAGIVHNHSGFMYGAGVACGDFNDDGYLDLYIPTARGQANRLYLNDGDLTFTESASSAGVGDSDSEGLGAVCGDVDNDGDLDLYVVNYFDANSLFLNNGDGTFSAASASAGVDDDGPGTSASLLDYDNDGHLDIYVQNRAPRNSSYTNKLFRNNGNGTFSDVTARANVGYHGYSLGVGCLDYDMDGDADIYVADEFSVDALYRNNGDGTFTNMAGSIQLPIGDAMGVDFADYDTDGDFDIYVANYLNDFLLRNNGDGTFTDVAQQSGMLNYGIGWGVNFFDFDNDGDRDVYVVNGAMIFTARITPNPFYVNNGDGTFTDMNYAYAVADSGDGRGSVVADFNNDGYGDLFVVNVVRGQSKLLVNPGGNNNWITLRLEGTQSNRSGVGAKVEVFAAGSSQIDEVRAGSSYGSMHPLNLEFGLGQASVVDSIIVRWPSGVVQKLSNVSVNQFLTITESSTTGIDSPGENSGIPTAFRLAQNFPNPFNSETVIRYQLPENGQINLEILNLLGQSVRVLEQAHKSAGEFTISWDGKDRHGNLVPSGVYFYRLNYHFSKGKQLTETKKMLLIE